MPVDLLDGLERGQHGAIQLAHRALALRAGASPKRFVGARVAAVFLNPSLRTKTSMDFAADAVGSKVGIA